MKLKNLLTVLITTTVLLLSVNNLFAQVPAHGSLLGADVPVWTGTVPVPADPASVQTNATMNYKVVTMNGKTWIWMAVSAGDIWADANSEFGYTTDAGVTATKFAIPFKNIVPNTNKRQITGSTMELIPGEAQLFMRPQVNLTGAGGGNGNHHTQPVNYNPAAYNSSTGETQKPAFPAGGPGKILTSGSITIELNATDNSENVFYYIVNETDGIADVIFTNTVTYTFPVTQPNHTYTVYAIDFSGNVSDPQTVYTANPDATQLPAPTGLALSADKKSLTFNNVANATGYLVIVFDGDNIIYEQDNYASGDALRYFLAGNLTIKIKAIGDGNNYSSSDFASIAWNVSTSELNLTPGAMYCDYLFNPPANNNCIAGNEDAAYFSWSTDTEGNIIIAIAPSFLVNGVTNQTEFRGSGINTPANIMVNGDLNAGNKYFTASLLPKEDGLYKKMKLTKTAGASIPLGSSISYTGSGNYIVYKTVVDGPTNTALGLGGALNDLYPVTPYTIDAPYIYGSSCPSTGTGICNTPKSVFSIYSPAKGIISIDGLDTQVEVKILDLLGKVLDTQLTDGEVAISNLPGGIYLLSVKGQTIKFVK